MNLRLYDQHAKARKLYSCTDAQTIQQLLLIPMVCQLNKTNTDPHSEAALDITCSQNIEYPLTGLQIFRIKGEVGAMKLV